MSYATVESKLIMMGKIAVNYVNLYDTKHKELINMYKQGNKEVCEAAKNQLIRLVFGDIDITANNFADRHILCDIAELSGDKQILMEYTRMTFYLNKIDIKLMSEIVEIAKKHGNTKIAESFEYDLKRAYSKDNATD